MFSICVVYLSFLDGLKELHEDNKVSEEDKQHTGRLAANYNVLVSPSLLHIMSKE